MDAEIHVNGVFARGLLRVSIAGRYCRWVCAGAVLLPFSSLAQTADTKAEVQKQARELQVESAKTIQNDLREIDEEIDAMQTLRRRLDEAKTSIQKAPVRDALVQSVRRLKAAYEQIQKKSGPIAVNDGALAEFASSLAELNSRGETVVMPFGRPDLILPAELSDMRLELGRFTRNVRRPKPLGLDPIELPKASALLETVRALPEVPQPKWEDVQPIVAAAAPEIHDIDAKVQTHWKAYVDAVVSLITDISANLDTAIGEKTAKKKSLSEQFESINKSLTAEAQQAAKQTSINEMLIWAVYGMVFSIAALFIILRTFPADLSHSIIRERTMIELLSMGFLLVTIIILGTGKLLGGETLGALLGTIAGYIFGRKEGERVASQQALQTVLQNPPAAAGAGAGGAGAGGAPPRTQPS